MGTYAAQCMAGREDETGLSFCFEIFTHVTRFLDKKVVLLGLYNGQKVAEVELKNLVSYSRATEVMSPFSYLQQANWHITIV